MAPLATLSAALCLLAAAAAGAQPLLPRCGPGLEGQVGAGGCLCRFDRGGQLTGRSAAWRWSCDLLQGPGAVAPVAPAPPPVPPGWAIGPDDAGY